MIGSTIQQSLRAALLEHLRWWISHDAYYRSDLYSQGRVNPTILRNLAKNYAVSRGMLQGKEAEVAALLETAVSDWPNGLTQRATFVYELAAKAKENGLTKGMQLSAFSKYMWFLKPRNWTMYDQYAAQGLTDSDKQKLDFANYYIRLETLDFAATSEAMRSVFASSEFHMIWPERVIDKFLMQRGLPNGSETPRILQTFEVECCAIFDTAFSSKLDRLINDLTDSVSGTELFLAIAKKRNAPNAA